MQDSVLSGGARLTLLPARTWGGRQLQTLTSLSVRALHCVPLPQSLSSYQAGRPSPACADLEERALVSMLVVLQHGAVG